MHERQYCQHINHQEVSHKERYRRQDCLPQSQVTVGWCFFDVEVLQKKGEYKVNNIFCEQYFYQLNKHTNCCYAVCCTVYLLAKGSATVFHMERKEREQSSLSSVCVTLCFYTVKHSANQTEAVTVQLCSSVPDKQVKRYMTCLCCLYIRHAVGGFQ